MAPNRPGLPSVSYRLGTYSSFRRAMLDQIPLSTVTDTATEDGRTQAVFPGLTPLTTRRPDDFSITLIELWAAVADTLSFYQERLANESFLRTAVQPDSVVSLAALAGSAAVPVPAPPAPPPAAPAAPAPVQPAPIPAPAPRAGLGTAAETSLLLTVDAGARVPINPGLRVQSVPGPDEKPVTFETIEATIADARFNRLRLYPPAQPPATAQPAGLRPGSDGGLLGRSQGPALSAALKPGDDAVLFARRLAAGGHSSVEEKKVAKVDVQEDRVRLSWQSKVTEPDHDSAFKFKRRFALFGSTAPSTYMQPAIPTTPGRISWTVVNLPANGFAYPGPAEESPATAPDGQLCDRLCLDGKLAGLDPGKRLLVADTAPDGTVYLVTIHHVDQAVATFGPFPGTVTRVWVSVDNLAGAPGSISLPDRRTVAVYDLDDPEIVFCAYDYDLSATAPRLGTRARLAGLLTADAKLVTGLAIAGGRFTGGVTLGPKDFDVGRPLIVDDGAGGLALVHVTDVPTLVPDAGDPAFGHLELAFDAAAGVQPATAAAKGNLVLASHGETVAKEVLGSGDASLSFQEFKLQKSPLTILPSASPGGRSTTLHVFVDGVEWREVASLAGQDGSAQVFVTDTGADGSTTVRFGDGKHGRVLTTGRSNVTATYRHGSGTTGNVRAGSLTTLLDRPTGLLLATNPMPAGGGTDAQAVPATKQAVGVAVRTMGRLVTLADLADLALTAGGVAKTRAALLRAGQVQVLQVTVAGQQGRALAPDELSRLAAAIRAAQDGTRRLLVQQYVPVPIVVGATIQLDGSAPAATATDAARQALVAGLGFDALGLGQTLLPGDVHALLEAVPGVSGVSLTTFTYKRRQDAASHGAVLLANGDPAPLQSRLTIFPARMSPATGLISPAEMAWVEVPGQDLSLDVKAPR